MSFKQTFLIMNGRQNFTEDIWGSNRMLQEQVFVIRGKKKGGGRNNAMFKYLGFLLMQNTWSFVWHSINHISLTTFQHIQSV